MRCDHCGRRRPRWALELQAIDAVADTVAHLPTPKPQYLCTECFLSWCVATKQNLAECLRDLRRFGHRGH